MYANAFMELRWRNETHLLLRTTSSSAFQEEGGRQKLNTFCLLYATVCVCVCVNRREEVGFILCTSVGLCSGETCPSAQSSERRSLRGVSV